MANIRRAVITGKETKYNDVTDLKGTTLGISRLGRFGYHTTPHCLKLKDEFDNIAVEAKSWRMSWHFNVVGQPTN